MPLDGHSYLVSQGWGGKGKALREGAISRPLTVAQRRTLSGVGKDRDEAFPFWDHVFSAAANAIQIKIQGDNDEDVDTPQPSGSNTPLDRTQTGIISNRPTKIGTLVLSSSTTLKPTTGWSVIASAKREAARRGLYARFFRGPVLGLGDVESVVLEEARAGIVVEALTEKGRRRGNQSSHKDAGTHEKRLRRKLKKATKKRTKKDQMQARVAIADETAKTRGEAENRKREERSKEGLESFSDHEIARPAVRGDDSRRPEGIRTPTDSDPPTRDRARKVDGYFGERYESHEFARKKKKRKRVEAVQTN